LKQFDFCLDVRKISSVILNINRAGQQSTYEQYRPWVLDEIKTLIPFDSACWANAVAEPMEIFRLHSYNCDNSLLERYQLNMKQDCFWDALIANPGITINLMDLTARALYLRTEFYRNFCRHFNIEWMVGTLMVEPISSLYEFLTLWRHDAKKPFSDSERQAKELLMPHLFEAHRLVRLREVLGEPLRRRQKWAISDDRGFLREAAPDFIHRLNEHWPEWRGSCLPPDLSDAVANATEFRAGRMRLSITAKGDLRYLEILKANALDRLSRREREIAERFANGQTYKHIAVELNISPTTVRNHLASCYRKLGVNNKIELALRSSL
jgi:DNA-binding CsgD family transcriptional regulator